MQWLQTVDWLSEISFLQKILQVFPVQSYILSFANLLHFTDLNFSRDGFESEFYTSWCNRFDDSKFIIKSLCDVIANYTESGRSAIILYDSP